MIRSWRFLAFAAVLITAVLWGIAPPVSAAQESGVAIELDFVTEAGDLPSGEVAVLDLGSGIEYRNDGVVQGDSIVVTATAGTTTELLLRRTDLSPTAVTCDDQDATANVAGSRVIVTPGDSGVRCTVTLGTQLPTTGTSPAPVLLGTMLVGIGTMVLGVARPRD